MLRWSGNKAIYSITASDGVARIVIVRGISKSDAMARKAQIEALHISAVGRQAINLFVSGVFGGVVVSTANPGPNTGLRQARRRLVRAAMRGSASDMRAIRGLVQLLRDKVDITDYLNLSQPKVNRLIARSDALQAIESVLAADTAEDFD